MTLQPPQSESNRVEHYCRVLAYCVGQCVEHRVEGHDVLLWNARRACEAMLYALAEDTPYAAAVRQQSVENKPIDHLRLIDDLRRSGKLHDTPAGWLRMVRQAGNLGAHTQAPEVIIDQTTLTGCLSSLAHAVNWFAKESGVYTTPPDSLITLAQELVTPTPRPSARRRLEADNANLAEQRDRAVEEAKHLRVEVKRLSGAPRPAAPPPLPAPEPTLPAVPFPVAKKRPKRTSLARPALAIILSAGLGFAGGARFGSTDRAEAHVIETAEAPTQATVAPATQAPTQPPTALPPTQLPTALPPTQPPTEPASACPPRMVRIDASQFEFEVGPFPRPKWPEHNAAPYRFDVPSFCIDAAPTTIQELNRYTSTISRDTRQGGCNPASAKKHVANCITAEQAELVCRSRGPTVRLPRIAEWEATRRSDETVKAVKIFAGTGEFVEDIFPPRVFGYTPNAQLNERMWFDGTFPQSGPRLSWNRAPKSLPTIAFRCASDLIPAKP